MRYTRLILTNTCLVALMQWPSVCLPCVLPTSQYMLKVNDVKTKRGVDLAEHLVGYYQAQEKYCMQRCTSNILRFTAIY